MEKENASKPKTTQNTIKLARSCAAKNIGPTILTGPYHVLNMFPHKEATICNTMFVANAHRSCPSEYLYPSNILAAGHAKTAVANTSSIPPAAANVAHNGIEVGKFKLLIDSSSIGWHHCQQQN
mmetsp:Transcript_39179/g.94735  ORF Transcript_39179/g.94735 Transcript_39179/m.94735 type:complete len:124 (+) Transcript_39179:1998-2369(+)